MAALRNKFGSAAVEAPDAAVQYILQLILRLLQVRHVGSRVQTANCAPFTLLPRGPSVLACCLWLTVGPE